MRPTRIPTIASTLVAAVRARGGRPATTAPDGPPWATVADRSRLLALGLEAVGVRPGTRVQVSDEGLEPHEVLQRELAALCVGAVLVGGSPGRVDEAAVTLGASELATDTALDLDDVTERGRTLDREGPARFEAQLAELDPDAPAMVLEGRTVSAGGATWALRCVNRWLSPGPNGPGVVLGVGGGNGVHPLTHALLGRWWPASVGAALAPATGEAETIARARAARPTVVVGEADHWAELTRALRDEAARTRAGRTLLRRGRVVESGESDDAADHAVLALARRRRASDVRAAAGLDRLSIGVCLGALDPVVARDLSAAGVPVTAAWVERGVLAPLASGRVRGPRVVSDRGRPLPGRTISFEPGRTAVTGGDLANPLELPRGARPDARRRVLIPPVPASVSAAGDAHP